MCNESLLEQEVCRVSLVFRVLSFGILGIGD